MNSELSNKHCQSFVSSGCFLVLTSGFACKGKMNTDYTCRVCETTENLEIIFKKENKGILAMFKVIANVSVSCIPSSWCEFRWIRVSYVINGGDSVGSGALWLNSVFLPLSLVALFLSVALEFSFQEDICIPLFPGTQWALKWFLLSHDFLDLGVKFCDFTLFLFHT